MLPVSVYSYFNFIDILTALILLFLSIQDSSTSNLSFPIFSGDQGMPNPGAGVDKVIYNKDKPVLEFNNNKLFDFEC